MLTNLKHMLESVIRHVLKPNNIFSTLYAMSNKNNMLGHIFCLTLIHTQYKQVLSFLYTLT